MFGNFEINRLAERLEFLATEFAAHYVGLPIAEAASQMQASWHGCTISEIELGAAMRNDILPEFEFNLVHSEQSDLVRHVSCFGFGRYWGLSIFTDGRRHRLQVTALGQQKPTRLARKLARAFIKRGTFKDMHDEARNPRSMDSAYQLLLEATELWEIQRDRRGPEGELALDKVQKAMRIFEEHGDLEAQKQTLPMLAALLAEKSGDERDKCIRESIRIGTFLISEFDANTEVETWASIARDLALTYSEKRSGYEEDNIELAIATLEEALAALAEPHYPESRAHVLSSLAQTYETRPRGDRESNLKEAARLYECAMRCGSDAQFQHQQNADRYLALARVNSGTDNAPETEPGEKFETFFQIYEQAVETARASGETYPLADSLRNLGDAYQRHGWANGSTDGLEALWTTFQASLLKSVQAYSEAASLLSREYHPGKVALLDERTARSYYLLAHLSALEDVGFENAKALYSARSDHIGDRTRSYLVKAIEHFQSSLDCHLPYSFERTREGLALEIANAFAQLREWSDASEWFAKAQSYISGSAFGPSKPRHQIVDQIERFHSIAEIGPFALVKAGRALDALAFADSRKAQLLARTLRINTAPLGGEERKRVEALLHELSELEARLISTELFARRPVIDRVIEIREEIDSSIGPTLNVSTSGIERSMRHFLDPETVIVAPTFSPLGGKVLIIGLNGEDIQIDEIDVGDNIDYQQLFDSKDGGWAQRYRLAIDALSADDPSADEHLFRAINTAATNLNELFLAHVLADTELLHGNVARLIIVPQGRLAQLPLNVAIEQSASTSSAAYDIIIAPSITSTHSLATLPSAPTELAVLIVATETVLRKPEMKFSRLEASLVGKLVEGSIEYFPERNLQETHLSSLPQSSIWHFPTHGEFNPSSPLSSSMQVGSTDHLLLKELFESPRLSIPDLVVLSACETGVYGEEAPDEFIGWPSAFLQLGAKGVVASLWPVETLPTTLLMGKFYEQLLSRDGVTVATALRIAQTWLKSSTSPDLLVKLSEWQEKSLLGVLEAEHLRRAIKNMGLNDKEIAFIEPLYWAGFTYYGVPDLILSHGVRATTNRNGIL